jgi:hypothetical protein
VKVAQRIDCVAPGAQGLEDALSVRQEALAHLSQADAPARPFEQSLAKVTLERLNARRHRWLSQEEGFRGPAEAVLVGYLDESL